MTTYACAYRSGAHIIIINSGENDEPFWQAIPKVVVHPNPAANYESVKSYYQSTCNANSVFPWDDEKHWYKPEELIAIYRPLLKNCIRSQLGSYGYFTTKKSMLLTYPTAFNKSNPFQDDPDLSKILSSTDLESIPLFPDVLIHYRCSDNIFFPNMGLLPFFAILSHIPVQSKYIFIVTESEFGQNADICVPIEEELANEIGKAFPKAQVVIRRGGDVFQIYAMLAHCDVVICSASSFCFYGATANVEGQVYLPTRPFYNSYINTNNIHTMENATSVYEWHMNGIDYNDTSHPPIEIVMKILHDRSYQHYHPRIPLT